LVFTHERYIYGEIAVIKNGVWSGKPSDGFGPDQCWEYAKYTDIISEGFNVSKATKSFKKAVIMQTPQTGGAFFQHFIDRGWSKIMQVWDMLVHDPEIKIIVAGSFKMHPNVEKLWARFGFQDRLVWTQGREVIHAEEMIFPCVAPHYHPYTYQKAQEALKLRLHVPLQERKKIVYLTRKDKSRPVVNEPDVLKAIEDWMAANGRDEELLVFLHKDWPDLDDLIRLFNEHTLAVIGPHGGAFYNVVFCPANTLVVEFSPTRPNGSAYRWPEAVWWPSHFTGQRYYQLPIDTNTMAMTVDPKMVVDILNAELL